MLSPTGSHKTIHKPEASNELSQLYTIAQQRHADLQRTAEHERLARAIRNPRRRTGNQRPITRLTARLTGRASVA